jgi:hypothetical protein
MGKWNDNEKKLCQAHRETDDTHRSDNNDQKSARWKKLVRDVAAAASDPSQPKGKKAIQNRLLLLRKDPEELEEFYKVRQAENAATNAATSLKKKDASRERWQQMAASGAVRPHDEVYSFHSVLHVTCFY